MMAKADRILAARRAAAAVYDGLLAGGPAEPVLAPAGQKPSYYKYMALLPEGADRETVKRLMRDDYGVALAGEVYATPLHRQPLWAARPDFLAAGLGDFPASDLAARRQICLPIWPGLAPGDQELVVGALAEVLGRL
jgi:dTDP-4-amino-4,6-dideoxygalactose transaminase